MGKVLEFKARPPVTPPYPRPVANYPERVRFAEFVAESIENYLTGKTDAVIFGTVSPDGQVYSAIGAHPNEAILDICSVGEALASTCVAHYQKQHQ